ncbi:MAG: BMP family ABC transporter substrate-binding protein [Aquincola tertiaricarbonis]
MFKNLARALRRPALPRIVAQLLLPASLLLLAPAPPAVAQPAPLKVGFVYVTPIGSAGWTYQHELGRQALQRTLGPKVQTTVVESVAEGADAERVMRDLAAQGHQLVFATSFGYLDPALRVAADHPAVRFEHAGGYKRAANLATYNARFYEGRWLAGYLAGRSSRTGVAGFVAGFPVPEVVQGINAFTLGMRAANPQATVRVVWLNTWFDPPKEREAALSLVNAGADVLTNHSGSPAVPQLAEEKGVRLVAYQSDMRAFAPKAQLAAITADWSGYYLRRTQAVLQGQWQSTATWGGLRDGMVALSAVDPALPAPVRSAVAERQQALVAGRSTPFDGPLKDQAGRVRHASGPLPDEAIASMDWFVEGVVGSVPGR